MLDFLRKRSGGVFSILIIGAIALVFVFWGIGGQDAGSPEDIRIDGQAVSQRDYEELWRNLQERLRDQNDGPLTPAQELMVRQQALAYLVERQLVLELARQTGRSVSDAEINRAVKGNALFQVDGRFDIETYKKIVPDYFNQTLAAFENAVKEDLIAGQVMDLLGDLSWSTSAAAIEEWRFSEESLSLDWAFFPASVHAAALSPGEEELAAWWAANRERWRVPAQVKVDFVEVRLDDHLEGIEVTEADLDDAFLEVSESLTVPERAVVRHILFRYPTLTPTDAERADAIARALEARRRAETEPFAALAEELSQDPATSSSGGEMTVERGQTLAPFEEAVFGPGKDQIGRVQGPIETFFGQHLLVVESYEPGHVKTREEAAEELRDVVVRRKARRAAVDRIEDLLEALPTTASPTNLADTAKGLGLEVQTSGFFHDANAAPAFLADGELIAEALLVPVGQTGGVIDTPDHLVVYSVVDTLDPVLPALGDPGVRDRAVEAWKAETALAAAKEAAERFLEATRGPGGWAAAAEALPAGAEKGRTPTFTRLRFHEAGGRLAEADPEAFLSAYFTLGQAGDQPAEPLPAGGDSPGWLALRLAETAAPDESALTEAMVGERRRTARTELGDAAYGFWSTTGRAKAKVELPAYLRDQLAQQAP